MKRFPVAGGYCAVCGVYHRTGVPTKSHQARVARYLRVVRHRAERELLRLERKGAG